MVNSIKSFLIVSSNPYIPQLMGGSERSSQAIATHLCAQGDSVSVLCGLNPNDTVGFWNRIRRRIFGIKFPVDRVENVKVYRAWAANGSIAHHIEEFSRHKSFDLVLVQAGFPFSVSREFNRLGVPSIVFLRDVEFHDSDGLPASGGLIRYIANSEFTAKRFFSQFGITVDAVIPPSVSSEKYLVTRSPKYALMVNPVEKKGLELVIELARRRSDINFLLQESWILSTEDKELLVAQIATFPNVTFVARKADMRSTYTHAKVLLVPSKLEEAWGRVVSEAHVSGIPVLASDIGGLPESVGPGGILLESGNVDAWERALAQVWDNPAYETALSQKAQQYALRPEIQPQFLFTAIDEQIKKALSDFELKDISPLLEI